MTEFRPIHFYDEPIQVRFEVAPVREKTPHCPDGFTWRGREHTVLAKVAEWSDFTRKGKTARNMQPEHAAIAAQRGSPGVGRFYFRVEVEGGRVFDIYYDRAPQDADRRKGQWFIYRELGPSD